MHPMLAVGSADGVCTTTNMLRGVRREGAVVSEEETALEQALIGSNSRS